VLLLFVNVLNGGVLKLFLYINRDIQMTAVTKKSTKDMVQRGIDDMRRAAVMIVILTEDIRHPVIHGDVQGDDGKDMAHICLY